MFRQYVPATRKLPEACVCELAVLADGFTGDDIRLIGKQMDMIQIRKAMHQQTRVGDCLATVEELRAAVSHFKSKGEELLKKHSLWNQGIGSYDVVG